MASRQRQTMEKPVPPDAEEVRTQTTKLAERIEQYAERIRDIKERQNSEKTARTELPPEEQEAIKTLNEMKDKFQSKLNEKLTIRNELNAKNTERQRLKARHRELTHDMKKKSVEEIDDEIARLTEFVNSEELTEHQEEECINEIKKLVKDKETLKSFQREMSGVHRIDKQCDQLMKELADVDKELESCRAVKAEQAKAFEKIKKDRADVGVELEYLNEEKQQCWDVLCALRDKKKEINDDYTEKMRQYRKLDQTYRQQQRQQEVKEQQEAQRKEEAEKKKAAAPAIEETKTRRPIRREKKNEKIENAPNKESEIIENGMKKENIEQRKIAQRQKKIDEKLLLIEEKVASCEYLLSYLASHNRQSEKVEEESNGHKETHTNGGILGAPLSPPDKGLKELHQQKDEDLEKLFAGTGKKSKHKKGKKPTKTEHIEDKRIHHTFQILQVFDDLKITVPNKQMDIPKCLELVLEKKHRLETVGIDDECSPSEKKPSDKGCSSESGNQQRQQQQDEEELTVKTISGVSELETEDMSSLMTSSPNITASVDKSATVETQDLLESDEMDISPKKPYVHCDFISADSPELVKIELHIFGDSH